MDVPGQTTMDDFLRGKAEGEPIAVSHQDGPAPPPNTETRIVVPESASRDAPATLPAFDPAESMAVDRELAEAHGAPPPDDLFDPLG